MKILKTPFFLAIVTTFVQFASAQQSNTSTIDIALIGKNGKSGHYLKTRGFNMYYEIYGKGSPMLFIHPNGGSIKSFLHQIPYFSKHHKVIIADSRAQGKSVDMSDSLNYEMMADDYNALLDSLHLDSCYVVGWSDGGINGLLLAIRHPEKVKKLAITGANLIPDTSVFNPGVIAMISESMTMLRSAKQDAATKNTMKLVHMMEVEPNIPLTDLHKIKCPVLVMGGDNDGIKPGHTLEIFENIPQAYLWIFPAAGHATLQRYKDEFNNKVKDFFLQPYHKPKWNDWDE